MTLLLIYILGLLITAFILVLIGEQDQAGWAILWPALCVMGVLLAVDWQLTFGESIMIESARRFSRLKAVDWEAVGWWSVISLFGVAILWALTICVYITWLVVTL